jgi:transmembrane sensor
MKDTMNVERALLERYLEGKCSPREKMLVEHTYIKYSQNTSFPDKKIDFDQLSSQSWSEIKNIIARPKKSKINRWRLIAAAAAVVFLLSAILIYRQNFLTESFNQVNDIAPGGNKAYLTLSNGKKIELGKALNGQLASQSGYTITKTSDGSIAYNLKQHADEPIEGLYNTIETPRGGQYQLILPDGTKVWLNAGSSLKYPLDLNMANIRNVELRGEGYFEVAHDKKRPFRVATPLEQVEVLGTHFNINSYADERSEKTTLIEGSVRITALSSQAIKVLLPGQQSQISDHGKLLVTQGDQDAVLAWKNGLFIFEDEDLETVMRKISRWYDVEVDYRDVDKQMTFGGSVSRYDNVSKILKKLEKVGGIHFNIEGRRIIVTR